MIRLAESNSGFSNSGWDKIRGRDYLSRIAERHYAGIIRLSFDLR
jgi:hypothetical protein